MAPLIGSIFARLGTLRTQVLVYVTLTTTINQAIATGLTYRTEPWIQLCGIALHVLLTGWTIVFCIIYMKTDGAHQDRHEPSGCTFRRSKAPVKAKQIRRRVVELGVSKPTNRLNKGN